MNLFMCLKFASRASVVYKDQPKESQPENPSKKTPKEGGELGEKEKSENRVYYFLLRLKKDIDKKEKELSMNLKPYPMIDGFIRADLSNIERALASFKEVALGGDQHGDFKIRFMKAIDSTMNYIHDVAEFIPHDSLANSAINAIKKLYPTHKQVDK